MASSRFKAVEDAFKKKPTVIASPTAVTSEYYGCNVFNRATMEEYLSSETGEDRVRIRCSCYNVIIG